MGRFLLGLWLLVFPCLAMAGELALVASPSPLVPQGELEILRDATGKLTLAEAQQAAGWKPNRQRVPNFSFDPAPYWLRLRLINPAPQARDWVFEIDISLLDYIDFYQIHANGQVTSYVTGDRRPFSTRPLDYFNFAFPLHLQAGETQEIYLRIANYDGIHEAIPLQLWELHAFDRNHHQKTLIFGLYFGAILVIVIYNLFVFIGVKDITYFYYVLYAATFLVFAVIFRGFAAQYLLPDGDAF